MEAVVFNNLSDAETFSTSCATSKGCVGDTTMWYSIKEMTNGNFAAIIHDSYDGDETIVELTASDFPTTGAE